MSEPTNHPFIPGARVAVTERYSDGVREAFVEKVYKSGNFTLRGSKQQWKPWRISRHDGTWAATETGSGWSRGRLDIWDENTDKEISAKLEAAQARQRWRDIRDKIAAAKEPTNALCDAIEAALSFPRHDRGSVAE